MKITAEITGIKYIPKLPRELRKYPLSELARALSTDASFLLEMDGGKIFAVSWWVSAKRTRSYPYARLYDTLTFQGKKVTIIPIFKDEGKDGDRDFLQWDTVSLMSLLGVYVIIAYYKSATKNPDYRNKITNQRYDVDYLKAQLGELLYYQSDALHWNMTQIDKVGELANMALRSYGSISHALNIKMHSAESARKRISELVKGRDVFLPLSRELAEKAQNREVVTVQPKEKLSGVKASITIKNYLGGNYFFTVDEARRENGKILLIEGKHTKTSHLPSLEDIKDGLLRMILYTNLRNVKVDSEQAIPIPVLLLTTGSDLKSEDLKKEKVFQHLRDEARSNRFQVMLNNQLVNL
ncbi:MAG: hypothetical protein FJ358_06050 [Thaumarchaeota archaeon]|nr:hypothetical protein [Nitrososphaerota archaeon]